MRFNYDLLNTHIKMHQNNNCYSEKQMNTFLDISRATRWRIVKCRPITMETFIKIISKLEKDAGLYFLKLNIETRLKDTLLYA